MSNDVILTTKSCAKKQFLEIACKSIVQPPNNQTKQPNTSCTTLIEQTSIFKTVYPMEGAIYFQYSPELQIAIFRYFEAIAASISFNPHSPHTSNFIADVNPHW